MISLQVPIFKSGSGKKNSNNFIYYSPIRFVVVEDLPGSICSWFKRSVCFVEVSGASLKRSCDHEVTTLHTTSAVCACKGHSEVMAAKIACYETIGLFSLFTILFNSKLILLVLGLLPNLLWAILCDMHGELSHRSV